MKNAAARKDAHRYFHFQPPALLKGGFEAAQSAVTGTSTELGAGTRQMRLNYTALRKRYLFLHCFSSRDCDAMFSLCRLFSSLSAAARPTCTR